MCSRCCWVRRKEGRVILELAWISGEDRRTGISIPALVG